MTAAAEVTPRPGPALDPAPGGRTRVGRVRRRRWVSFVVPLGVTALFWAVSLVAHALEQPDFSDLGTLSPTGTGPHGSSQLADRLRMRGVTVIPVDSTDAALAAASRLDATIFVPTTDYAGWWLMPQLLGMRDREHRVVLVRPDDRFSAVSEVTGSRWATATVAPGCAMAEAKAAGPAAVHRDSYAQGECYQGSLVELDLDGLDLVVVGATDPFRNDRIDEAGNAALATGLLSAHGRVIWLDTHRRPPAGPDPNLPQLELPDYERDDQNRDRTNTGDPLLDAFPEQLWVGMVLLLGAGVLFAVARGRRLGPPVAEPLPVLVPAAEAVLGRGRLYRRIRARGASLATLRSAAIARIARVLDPLNRTPERALAVPGAARDRFVAAVADRARVPQAAVSAILFGPGPADDEQLVRAVEHLDRLVDAVIPPTPRQPGGSR